MADSDIPSGYLSAPIETDPDALQEDAFDYMQVQFPGWRPNEGKLESWMIGAMADMVSEARDVASDVPVDIIRYLGSSLFGVPPIAATPAYVDTTWNVDASGAIREIAEGTVVFIEGLDGEPVYFEVVDTVTVPAAATSVTNVTIQATEDGADGSNLGGVGETVEQVDTTDWVNSVVMLGITQGGQDEEDIDDYLDRLARHLTLLTPRPILARDYALLARELARIEGLETRVLAIDNYNPADGTTNNERMVAVGIMDIEGADLPAPVKTSVDAQLQAMREVNFIVNVVNPSRTTVDVTFAIKTRTGYDATETLATAVQAVKDYLSPASWGTDTDSEIGSWVSQTVVRHQDISTVINNVPGVSHWTTLTIGLNGGAQSAADANLPNGPFAISTTGTVNGTIAP